MTFIAFKCKKLLKFFVRWNILKFFFKVVIVAGAPSVDDDIEVVNADDGKEGRAIVIDGIPVDNSASGQAGFKLLKADDIKGTINFDFRAY